MISIAQAIILGVVEGLTEFLPVSSTAHLRITEALLGVSVDDPQVIGFTAVIQTGAIAAVLVYFATDIFRIAGAWLRGLADRSKRSERDYRFGWWIIIATLPVVVVGVAAKPLLDGPLASLWVVAASLVAGSALMFAADRRGSGRRSEDSISLRDSLIVGSSQILALLFPGFSRSGASISTGLLLGLDRVAATRLSFFLSIPALTGAGVYELKAALGGGAAAGPLVVGTLVSFAVAYATIAWLLRFVARHTFGRFVAYRLVLASVLVVALLSGQLVS